MMGYLYPDLVVPPGVKTDFDERDRRTLVFVHPDSMIVEPGIFRAGSICCTNAGSVCTPVFYQMIFQITL